MQIVLVGTPACWGTCQQCGDEVKPITSDCLPDTHPGSKLNPPIGIMLVRQTYVLDWDDDDANAQPELDRSALVCLTCALALPEINGYWGSLPELL